MSVCIEVKIKKFWSLEGETRNREEAFDWFWAKFYPAGLQGIYEGDASGDDVDSAMVDPDRDWVSELEVLEASLYFDGTQSAEAARELILAMTDLTVSAVTEIPNKDWNAEWRKHFRPIELGQGWRIVPSWHSDLEPHDIPIEPGAGFGTGTHETTELCLRALIENMEIASESTLIDFGSGSGILSVAALRLGWKSALGVEIDLEAIENAKLNADLNRIQDQVTWKTELKSGDSAPTIVANTLKPVLEEYCDVILKSWEGQRPGSRLWLSGLLEGQESEVVDLYKKRSSIPVEYSVKKKGEWVLVELRPKSQ